MVSDRNHCIRIVALLACIGCGTLADAARAGTLDLSVTSQQLLRADDVAKSGAVIEGPVAFAVLLGPGEDVAAIRESPWPLRHLGTGYDRGFAIAHFSVEGADLRSNPRGGRLLLETRAAPFSVTRMQRPDAHRALETRRSVQRRVLNADALGLYSEPLLAAAPVAALAPTETPSLEGSAVDMLILTRESLAAAFQEYADARSALGIPTVVRSVEWVEQNVLRGADLQETLRNFIRMAYQLWGIRAVLLGGDTDLIPARYAWSVYSLEGNSVPTDLYYACLDGNWNADGDARWGEGFVYSENSSDMADLYPEVLIGRLPVTTAAEVDGYRIKMQKYVEPAVLDYQNKAAFFAEVIWPATYKPGDPILKNGADNAERIINQNGMSGAGIQLTRLYETPALYPNASALTLTAALAAMNSGNAMVTDIGHGFRYTMSLGDLSMTNVQALGLTNADRPFFLNMLNCSAAAFDFPCLAEKFILNPTGGAIGVIGSSREAYPDNIQLFQEAWFKKLYVEGYRAAGEALHEGRLQYLSQTYDDGAYRWSNFITTFLGDPTIPLWTAAARSASVIHTPTLTLGTSNLPVLVQATGVPIPGATVCVWKSDGYYAVGRTNLSGVANLSIRAEVVGPASITVSGAGLIPYRGTIMVNELAGPMLRATGLFTVQDSGDGAIGNGNGRLEAGETARVRFEVQNQGGGTADGVTLQAFASDPSASLQSSSVTVGTLAAGAKLLSAPITLAVASNVPDQYHLRVELVLRTVQTWTWTDRVGLDLLQVAPRLQRIWVDDSGGNYSGTPDANETYYLRIEVKNHGFATLNGATAQLVTLDPDVTVIAGTTTLGTLAHLAVGTGVFTVRESNVAQPNRMLLVILDSAGRSWSQSIETRRPLQPSALAGDPSGGPGVAILTWSPSTSSDLDGYTVYRATKSSGPWSRASADRIRNATYFRDDGLQPGARYYYNVSAVDSSGNESPRTATVELTTNPAQVSGWPRSLRIWSNSSPVVADLDGDLDFEVVAGAADRVYAWNADGQEVLDGDGNPLTGGVFNPTAGNFMPGLAAGDLDGDGNDEIVACTFDTKKVYVLEGNGSIRTGWPRGIVSTTHGIWATPALADLDLDGRLEIIVLALDGRVYVWRHDGTEFLDGDADPATQGVFFVSPSGSTWSRGAPTVANLLPADAAPEIVFGTESNRVYVLRASGTVAPGWPRVLGDRINAAPSLGDIDADGALEIAVPCRDGQLYVFRADGSNENGWPRPLPNTWNALTPSVALHDFDGDGKLELVAGSTGATTGEGHLYVFDWQGNVRPGWPVNVFSASEASPIIGDLNGDGTPEIIYGGESGVLHGFRPDGTIFPGFPIKVGAEIRATPTITDANGDGRTDLLLAGWDQQVYLWSFSGLFIRRNVPWGAFKGNMLRNGVYAYREPTDAGDASVVIPLRTALHANVPNPFNPTTVIRFDVGGEVPQAVRLVVYDVRGRQVRSLLDSRLAPGRYSERWDGRDDLRRSVASGVYFYELTTPDLSRTRKMILLR